MQINIHLLNPLELKIAFIYERIDTNISDGLDEEMIFFAERLSSSVSIEPYNIKTFRKVNFINFDYNSYNYSKIIWLLFRTFYKDKDDLKLKYEKKIPLILYFDTIDEEYINNIIRNNYEIVLSKALFDCLGTLITE